MKKFFRTYLLLICIFLLAFFLRTYKLGSVPYGLHEDEVMNGYVGRFILQNGKDLYGNRWPLLYFNNFGDYPNVIPMYLSGLSTYVFGINAFAIRFPIALAGALSVFPVYLIGRQIFVKKKYSLLTAFFLAILPWHIILSRSTAENVTATFVYLFALYFLLLFLRYKKRGSLLVSSVLGLATYFLYPSYRVIIPLTFLASFLFFFKKKSKNLSILVVAVCFFVLTALISRTTWGQGRFHQTSLFYFNNMVASRMQTYIYGEGTGHILEAHIFYNKPLGFAREFIHQTLSYFSPTFLFTDAGKPDRYRLSDTGIMYVAFLVMVITGIGVQLFWKQKKNSPEVFTPQGKQFFLLILVFLGLSVIPAALTLDDIPNIHRALPLGMLSLFFVTYCVSQVELLQKSKKIIYAVFFGVLMLESVYFWHQWMVYGPIDQAPFRDQGRVALAKYLIDHHSEYDAIFLSKETKVLYYLLYGNNFDPSLTGKFAFNIYVDQLDNLHYIDGDCVTRIKDLPITTQSLVVDLPDCPQNGSRNVKRVNSPRHAEDYSLVQVGSITRIDTLPAFNLFVATKSAVIK